MSLERGVAAGLLSMTLAAAAFLPRCASGQDLEPRQYANAPVGMNFLVLGYARSTGGVLFDPSVQLENADVKIDGPVIGYARTLALAGRSARLDAGIGYACLSGTAEYRGEPSSREVCGFGDARMRLSVNLLGAPAYRAPEFAGYRQRLILGASFALTTPNGQYDADRLVNIGTNRWSAKAEIGLSRATRRWLVEMALGGTVYQDNDDFFGGKTRQQDPIGSVQAHGVRIFPSGSWLAIDATYYRGGQTTVDGSDRQDQQANARFGVTWSMPVGLRQSIKVYASSGVFTRTGSDYNTAGLAWQYRWGGATPE